MHTVCPCPRQPRVQAYVIAPGALATPRTYYNTYAPKQSTSPRGSTLGQSLPSPHSHSRRRFSRCTIAMPPSQQRRNSNGASDPKSVAIPPASPQALLRAHAGVSPTVTHASPDKLKLDPLQEELPSGMESTLVTGGLDEEQTDPVPTGVSEAAGIASQTQKNSVGVGPVRRGSMLDNVPVQTVSGDGCYTAVLIVPTGIGAAIGGYAGDALPVARSAEGCGSHNVLVNTQVDGRRCDASSSLGALPCGSIRIWYGCSA